MKLTTKGRYAVTAILDVALHQSEGPTPLAEVSARQGISLSYLEQLFARLRKTGLVVSTRGPGGGYSLARDVKDIVIADIINAVDEIVDSTGCGNTKDCDSHQPCLSHNLWAMLSDQIRQFLSGITLAETMSLKSVRDVATRQDMRMRQYKLNYTPLVESRENAPAASTKLTSQ